MDLRTRAALCAGGMFVVWLLVAMFVLDVHWAVALVGALIMAAVAGWVSTKAPLPPRR